MFPSGTFNLDSRRQSAVSGDLGDMIMLLSNADVDQSMDWALEASKHPIDVLPPPPPLSGPAIQPSRYIHHSQQQHQQQQEQPDSQYQGEASPTKSIRINSSSSKRLKLASIVNSPIDNAIIKKQHQQQQHKQQEEYGFSKEEKEAAVNKHKEQQQSPSPLSSTKPQSRPPQPSPPIVNIQVHLQVDGKVQLAEMQCEQLIKKLLTATDTGRLGRIILPRYQVENHLPVASCISNRDAGLVIHAMELRDWQKRHALTLKYWVNGRHSPQVGSGSNSSSSSSSTNSNTNKNNDKRMWLFEGTRDLVAGKKPGDVFCLYKAVNTGHYFVDC